MPSCPAMHYILAPAPLLSAPSCRSSRCSASIQRPHGQTPALAALALCAAASPVASAASPVASALPIVDLGYERHQAISFNETGGFYNFSNIRYGQPPVGQLRFAAPLSPTGHSNEVNNGSVGSICPQASAGWEQIASNFVPAFLKGQPFNVTLAFEELAAELANFTASGVLPPQDPRTTEDCLFLDVFVPQKIIKEATQCSPGGGSGAPVMVWIYGGGYTTGSKDGNGAYDPAGLIHASQVSGSEGLIFVALNYRLGAFGWLGGPTLQESTVAQPGLYDQRLALEWVQSNIHLFGGDKNRVTVIGESAGGGSIMHQITAFGGRGGPVPFAQAITQSAAFAPMPGSLQQEEVFQGFLTYLGVSTLEEARALPSDRVILANIVQVINSNYGTFTYGPLVDGVFTPALPGRLLASGNFHKNLKVMVGHNEDEGLDFTSPLVTDDASYSALVEVGFPDISPTILNEITTVLYPPVFDGSYGYLTQFERAIITVQESSFTCNTIYLDSAFKNQTYAYQFDVPPALHGNDIPYTFANGFVAGGGPEPIAAAMQEYFTSFVINGAPSGPGLPKFPMYGSVSDIINFNATSVSEIVDDIVVARCAFWQKALYY